VPFAAPRALARPLKGFALLAPSEASCSPPERGWGRDGTGPDPPGVGGYYGAGDGYRVGRWARCSRHRPIPRPVFVWVTLGFFLAPVFGFPCFHLGSRSLSVSRSLWMPCFLSESPCLSVPRFLFVRCILASAVFLSGPGSLPSFQNQLQVICFQLEIIFFPDLWMQRDLSTPKIPSPF
jgi:hypothetical protein